jgi:hypothetical protein
MNEWGFAGAVACTLAVQGPALVYVTVRLEGRPDVPRITSKHSAPQIATAFSASLDRG